MDRAGVYRASCGDCNAWYVGQTGQKLETRISEHKTKKESAFFQHCSSSGHNPQHSSFRVLHRSGKGKVMNSLEEIETVKFYNDDSLNDLSHVLEAFYTVYYNLPLTR